METENSKEIHHCNCYIFLSSTSHIMFAESSSESKFFLGI